MALVRSRDRLSEVLDLTAYLFTALRRVAGRLAAREARQPVAAEALVRQTTIDRQGPASSNPHGERLDRALRALPPKQREVIAMKIDGELTFAQIGAVLGVSPNTAASRYRYALEKLRRSLEDAN